MKSIDFDLQREMLLFLRESYPETGPKFHEHFQGREDFLAQACYLRDHGLISAIIPQYGKGKIVQVTITKEGLDYLDPSGGLTLQKKAVTIRFDPEDLRKSLIQKVQESREDSTIVEQVSDQVKKLPAEAIKAIAQKLLSLGMDNAANLIQLIISAVQK